MEHFLLNVVFCIIWTPLAISARWNYDPDSPNGPSNWAGICQTGKKQTPIHIHTTAATYDQNLGAPTLTNYDATPSNTKFTALNNGHSLTISFPDKVYNVSGGGLTGIYTMAQFHLHWGSVNTQGSEHFMDGKAFAAELHFVNYNTKYSSISVAVDKDDGLAVLGVFIEVEGDNNTAYSFLDNVKDVVYTGEEKANIPAFKLRPMLPTNLTKYFRYSGSISSPGCYESVTWTVFNDVVKISQSQMDMLRMLKDASNKTLVDNYRPIQPLNARVVNSSFMVPEPPDSNMTTAAPPPTDNSTVTFTPPASNMTTAAPLPIDISTSPASKIPTVTPTATVIPTTADASAINMAAGLFLLMLIAAIFVH